MNKIDNEETSPILAAKADGRVLDVVVVGAGFSGLYAAYRLQKGGWDFQVIEAGGDVGGTWYWNRYPGARCDVQSLDYSYSFDEQLQQEWRWSERYATQPEILRYACHVAERYDLRRHIRFNTEVVGADFDDARNRWTLRLGDGSTLSARFFIMAGGVLSLPQMPAFPGRDSFRGHLYHTGRWPKEPVSFAGRRVGVIGTGASGIQAIPVIAQEASELVVFQRTPNFSIPANNGPVPEAELRHYLENYPAIRQAARYSQAGNSAHAQPRPSALDDPPGVREQVFEDGWRRGSSAFIRVYKDILFDEAANAMAADFARRKIRERVRDPQVAQQLLPTDHPIGTKRVPMDSGYYETFNRDNVKLVNLRQDPIECIVADGIQTRSSRYELDDIVFATGFDAITGAVMKLDLRNGAGAALADKWQQGICAYLGLMTAGYPNLFLINGPGSPSVFTNVFMSIEQHVEWVTDCLAWMRDRGLARIDADAQAELAWAEEVDAIARKTLYPRVNSWYVGANVPGKRRQFTPYVGGLGVYRRRCEEVAAAGYQGFRFA